MARCRTCQQEIVWAKTAAGKSIPMDPPQETRWVATDPPPEVGIETEDMYVKQVAVMVTHFATCPQADQHRKPKKPIPGSTEDYRGD